MAHRFEATGLSDDKDTEKNPFVKGSVYRVRSLGTHNEATVTTGTFLGFTPFGMGGEGLKLELGSDHGSDEGKVRVVPNHMVLHVDVLEQKESEEPAKDDGHPVFYS